MNKVTSFTCHRSEDGMRISITHSVIDDTGKIVNDNVRTTRVVMDADAQGHIDALMEFSQTMIE